MSPTRFLSYQLIFLLAKYSEPNLTLESSIVDAHWFATERKPDGTRKVWAGVMLNELEVREWWYDWPHPVEGTRQASFVAKEEDAWYDKWVAHFDIPPKADKPA